MHASSTEPRLEELTCAARVRGAWQSRRADLAFMLRATTDNESVYITPHNHGDEYTITLSTPVDDWEIDTICGDEMRGLILDAGHDNLPIDPNDWDEDQREDVYTHLAEHYEDQVNEIRDEAFHSYGLCFDYVAPGTFDQQETGYWRYQISWGGPSEEIRFYGSPSDNAPALIEFWFLDWFDGAPEDVTSDEIARLVWDEFSDMDMLQSTYEEATE